MENPPLWVWAIIIGAIIASKFIYRWQATKHFAKEQEGAKEFTNNDLYGNIDRHSANIRAHKYSPKRYYKDYFSVKNKKKRE